MAAKHGLHCQKGYLLFQGVDHQGPTSVIKSASKIDHLRTGGTLLNQKFSPQFFEDEDSYPKLTALIRSYFSLDGHHIQFNVVNAETLREAQKHPELYRDLIVRVAGYSDYFNDLGEDLQNEIIRRTEHEELIKCVNNGRRRFFLRPFYYFQTIKLNIMFSTETYVKRRDLLRRSVGKGIILLLGNEESPMNYADNTYHFRQDSTFLYFFGLNFAGLAAVLDCETGEDIVFGNDLTVEDFVWMGPQPTIAERAKAAGIKKAAPLTDLVKLLDASRKKGRRIHFLPPYRAENKVKLFEWLGVLPSESKAQNLLLN